MKKSTIVKLVVGGLLLLIVIGLVITGISTSNQEIELRNSFNQKIDERTAFYDKLWKVLNQKSQVAKQNDSSFRRNIDLIMSARKDSGLLFKFVQESNPNANYSEVSALYKDLSRTIESERVGFFQQEKYLQDIKFQHDNLIKKFPGRLYLSVFGNTTPLIYKPITSDRTDEVIKSGKDNDVSLGL